MRLNDIISMALANLWRRKLRTALTILAVVIGATLVALMVSIGSGLQGFIVGQFGMAVSPRPSSPPPKPTPTFSISREAWADRTKSAVPRRSSTGPSPGPTCII